AGLVGRQFNYTGIGDIDVKYDARDRRYKYLELNPRLGMCHYFGTCCGKNVTLDAYRLACGEDLPEDAPQLEGRTFLAVLEEIGGRLQDGDSLLAALRGLLGPLLRRPVGAGERRSTLLRTVTGRGPSERRPAPRLPPASAHPTRPGCHPPAPLRTPPERPDAPRPSSALERSRTRTRRRRRSRSTPQSGRPRRGKQSRWARTAGTPSASPRVAQQRSSPGAWSSLSLGARGTVWVGIPLGCRMARRGNGSESLAIGP